MVTRITTILALTGLMATGLVAACAPMPATPPGQAEAPPARRAYPVYFEPWSAALDDAAVTGLKQASDLARANPSVPLVVIGYADPAGSPQANITLSQLRATVVADELKRNGVAVDRIRQEWHGSTDTTGIASRRVEIRIDQP